MVNVIMITYNHETYVEQAIESVIMQKTNFKFNLIIAEDSSTDRTRAICYDYEQKFPEIIRLLRSKSNLGMIKNGIVALKESLDSRYIALCEGDDFWTDPYKLQKQVDFMEENNDFSLVFHRFEILEKSKKYHSPNIKSSVFSLEDFATMKVPIQPLTVLFRNNLDPIIPDEYEEKITGFNFILIRLAEHGNFKYINEVMATYRVHGGGVWSGISYFNRHLNGLKNMLAMIEYMNKNKFIKGLLIRSYLKKVFFFILYTVYKLEFRFTIKFLNKLISLSRI